MFAFAFGACGYVFVVNALIGMYGKWGLVGESQKVFQWAVDRDLYSWNTLIAAYVGSGNMSLAKELFDGMRERDVVSWSTIIAGYVQVLVDWKVKKIMTHFTWLLCSFEVDISLVC